MTDKMTDVTIYISQLVNKLVNLSMFYHQVEVRSTIDSTKIPMFRILLEFIRDLKMNYLKEIIDFQVKRVHRISNFKTLENEEPVDMLKNIITIKY